MDFSLNLGIIGQENSKTVRFDKDKLYDVIIIGGGPAGLTAAVYCMRKGLKTGIILKNVGGQVSSTKGIENYMGYRYIEGMDLVEKFKDQVKQFEIAYSEEEEVTKLEIQNDHKILITDKKNMYKSKSVIIATGSKWKKLGIPGEEEFIGKGIAYCTTCDAPLFKDKNVVVVGGGNSGVEAALELASIAKTVKVVEYMPKINADKILQEKLSSYNNCSTITNKKLLEIKGQENLESIIVKDRGTKQEEEIMVDGVFIEIGLEPNSEFVKNIVKRDERNYIMINCKCETNIDGIFAAGDVSNVMYNQIIIASGEGAKAALSAYKYIMEN